MKMTLDIDEAKLKRVMELTGIGTKTEAVDFALGSAERLARLARLRKTPPAASLLRRAVEPDYDLTSLRERERPAGRRRAPR